MLKKKYAPSAAIFKEKHFFQGTSPSLFIFIAFLSYTLSKIKKETTENLRFDQYLRKNLQVQIILPIFWPKVQILSPPPIWRLYTSVWIWVRLIIRNLFNSLRRLEVPSKFEATLKAIEAASKSFEAASNKFEAVAK